MAGSTTKLSDAISGDRADQLASDLGHHKSRLVIKEVVEDVVGSSIFAGRIKDIQLEALEADPARAKLKDWVIALVDKHLNEQGIKKRNFQWTVAGAVIGGVTGIAGVLVAIFKP